MPIVIQNLYTGTGVVVVVVVDKEIAAVVELGLIDNVDWPIDVELFDPAARYTNF